MAKTPERSHDKPALREKASQQWSGVECRGEQFAERGTQDRFKASDLKAILNPKSQSATPGRKPLFRL